MLVKACGWGSWNKAARNQKYVELKAHLEPRRDLRNQNGKLSVTLGSCKVDRNPKPYKTPAPEPEDQADGVNDPEP